MFIKAMYRDGRGNTRDCYINTNYILDVFEKDDYMLAFVKSKDREGYMIAKAEFERFMEVGNE